MYSNKNKLEPEEIVARDLEEIYLGNLNTVEVDLKLPNKGRNGSAFTWHSKETLFLSNEGKVTRPTFGVGNRTVPLVVSACYENICKQKEYRAMILEQPREKTFTEILPVNMKIEKGKEIKLPPVVIAKEDSGIHITLPVEWEKMEPPTASENISIKGKVEGTALAAEANIHILSDEKYEEKERKSTKITPFASGAVELRKGTVFYESQERMVQFLLNTNDDQMLYNFRTAAGIDTKGAPPMTGWDAPDCNLKGHTTGHYLSALSLGWSATKNLTLYKKADYMIRCLKECQDALEKNSCHYGFLSAYSEEQFDLLEKYTTYPTIWAPYYTLDKIMTGLSDCYLLMDNKIALEILIKMGDWVYNRLSKLSKVQLEKMWSMYIAGEFGGMISVMVKLYQITKCEKYLETAGYFCNEKLFYPMNENVDTLKDMHANQHIPQIIGALDLYTTNNSDKYFNIAKNFWDMMIHSHAYSIGGVGETEMFHEPKKVTAYLSDKTAESCASYNLLILTAKLFAFLPESLMMDYYELVLYNHILASCSHNNDGGTTYFMPLRPAGHKEFSTDENTCCHGTGLESRFRYFKDIYSHNEDEVYVNLYIASNLKTDEIELEQHCLPGKPGYSKIIFRSSEKKTLCLRVPSWCKDSFEIKVCGKDQIVDISEDGYARINREWGPADFIEVSMVHKIRFIPDENNPDFISIAYGPYILAALSDSEDYIFIDDDLEVISNKTKMSDSPLHFLIDGITFMPLAEINGEKYHIYFKRKSN